MSGTKGFNSFLNTLFKGEGKDDGEARKDKPASSSKFYHNFKSSNDNILFTPSASGDKDLMALLNGGGIFKEAEKNTHKNVVSKSEDTSNDRQRG